MKNIAIFASGSGTNAQNIIEYVQNNEEIKIKLILSNKKNAFVLERAKKFNIESVVFSKTKFYNSDEVLSILTGHKIDFIVLAGFLWLMPQSMVQYYEGKMVNIHPALLPKYGGKGMYGMNVHKAIIQNKEKESGITIHYVNNNYDEGDIILQKKCKIDFSDTPESLAKKIHTLEYDNYPKIVEKLVMKYPCSREHTGE